MIAKTGTALLDRQATLQICGQANGDGYNFRAIHPSDLRAVNLHSDGEMLVGAVWRDKGNSRLFLIS
jgi:hypothetical protein